MRNSMFGKSRVVSLLLVFLLIASTIGCASGKKSESGAAPNMTAERADFSSFGGADKGSTAGTGSNGSASKSSEKTGSAPQNSIAQQQSSSTQSQLNSSIKKIIRNANTTLEAKDANEAFDRISQWVQQNGGYEFSRNVSVNGKYRKINAVFKLLPEKLDEFLQFIEGTGRITGSNISSNDITDQYYDAAARLDNMKKGREQLLEIQKRAVTIDETLKVQNELNKITGEIEALQGKLTMWDKMVAESTVTLTIAEEADPMKPAPQVSWKFSSFGDILKTMRNGFILTANTLVNAIVWIFVFIASASPVLIILIIGWFVYRKLKGRNNSGKM